MLDLFGVSGGGTLGQNSVEQERSYLAAKSGKDRAYKAGRLKSWSETRWREGALLWSRRRGGKREGMPETANNSSVKARELCCPTMDASQVCSSFVGFGEGSHSRHDTPAQDRIARTVGRHVRFIKKIIVKPCAICGR